MTKIQIGRSDRMHLIASQDRTNPQDTIALQLLTRGDVLLATARASVRKYQGEEVSSFGCVTNFTNGNEDYSDAIAALLPNPDRMNRLINKLRYAD
jgi:hypothetical protein